MSYFSNTKNESSLSGPGCGSGCGCAPCRSGGAQLSEWYEKAEEVAQSAPKSGKDFSPTGTVAGYGYPGGARGSLAGLPTRVCDDRPPIPTIGPITAFTPNRVHCASTVFGESDPAGVIRTAVARALQMLDNTIGELVEGRRRVCQGEPPAYPVLGDITLEWLKTRLSVCIDDIRVWTAGTFVNRSVAEVIRRLVRVRNLIASNHIRYICGGLCNPSDPASPCTTDTWAFVCLPPVCTGKAVPSIIHLCKRFWDARIPPNATPEERERLRKIHKEFQAQTIIHEASHLFYCITRDPRGRTIGIAECMAQFVAATNNSPIDCDFRTVCSRTTVCGPAVTSPEDPCPAPAVALGGFASRGFASASPAGSGSVRIVRTVFRPENAIRLKGRPAVRQQAARR